MDEDIQLLARLLVDHGLEHAFGVTGSGLSLALITELESLGVRYCPASHEASAALMAGAVARTTGRVSCSISIKGPGLANMLPGIVHNHFEGNPALSISEAFGGGVPLYRRHKRLDHGALLASVVKACTSLDDVDRGFPSLMATAHREVPGPVHLDLCSGSPGSVPTTTFSTDGQASSEGSAREEVTQKVAAAERPILVVGSLALRRSWKERLEALSIPVFTTAAAKGVVDEGFAHAAGVFTGDGKELVPEWHLISEADLVVGVGLRNTEVLTPKPFGRSTVLVDEVNGGLADGFQADLLSLDADRDAVADLLDILSEKRWGLDSIDLLRQAMQRALLDTPWLPAACFEILNDLTFPYALTMDTGSFCTIGEHLWRAGPERPFLGGSNDRYMGVALPSALGVALATPGVPVFCVVGDGGMRTYPAELKLAVQESLPLCVILMTDGRYGSVACAPQSRPMSSRAISVFQPSWWKAAEAMGCEACQVESEGSFERAVRTWKRQEPLFIEAAFDPEAYLDMTRRLR